MKKLIATLVALMMLLGVAACALAEEETKQTIVGNVQFDMDMDQVMQQVESLLTTTKKEIEGPKMRGTTEFYELEYEDVVDADDVAAIATYQSGKALLVAEEISTNGDARHSRATVLKASQRVGLKNLVEGANIWNHFFNAHLGTVQRFTGFSIKHSAL